MRQVRIHKSRRLLDDWISVDEAQVSFESHAGSLTGPHRLMKVERADAVAVLLVDGRQQELLLVEQFRWPTQEKGPGWIGEIVAGVIDPGEAPEDTARREALEEAGAELGPLQPIAVCYPTPGYSTERTHIFAAEIVKRRHGGGGVDAAEDIRPIRLPFAEVAPALSAGRFVDAKTIIALQWFLLNGR